MQYLSPFSVITFGEPEQRRHPTNPPLTSDEMPSLPATTLLPEDDMVRKETFAHLRGLLDTLSPRRQEVITLRFFGGLQNSEIAEVLGLDERTVASHLCR